jgi:hypothetical protein
MEELFEWTPQNLSTMGDHTSQRKPYSATLHQISLLPSSKPQPNQGDSWWHKGGFVLFLLSQSPYSRVGRTFVPDSQFQIPANSTKYAQQT